MLTKYCGAALASPCKAKQTNDPTRSNEHATFQQTHSIQPLLFLQRMHHQSTQIYNVQQKRENMTESQTIVQTQ